MTCFFASQKNVQSILSALLQHVQKATDLSLIRPPWVTKCSGPTCTPQRLILFKASSQHCSCVISGNRKAIVTPFQGLPRKTNTSFVLSEYEEPKEHC
ncbi:hypothetical protein FKM82_024564 [Ascaphus truei]